MAANAINNLFGVHSHGLGAFGGLGLTTSTKPPLMERYHDEHGWQKTSKGSKKGNVALSALTLLAFLFFLHILQNCIQEHMHDSKGQYKGPVNPVQNFSNILVIDPGANIARKNPKGDDGILSNSEQAQQRRSFNSRPKKQERQKSKQESKHYAGHVASITNAISTLLPVEKHDADAPMHRIDDIP